MKKAIIIILTWLFALPATAQISVVNLPLMAYSVTPESMLSASLLNAGSEQQVTMVSKLFNLNNELLLLVKSAPFTAKTGLNSGYSTDRKAIIIDYSSGNQANYIKTTHGLPSGAFKICVELYLTGNNEPSDDFCEEIQSEFNHYLYLVFPLDKETIPTTSPLLTWSHSEPFNILSQGESYRMTVVEIKSGQSPEEAIIVNSPVMLKDFLTSHTLQYPYEAKALEEGKRYAWQVDKLANGIVLNKTETWEFRIAIPEPVIENKYATLGKVLDGSFYQAENNKVFFKFTEDYSSGEISCVIYNSKNEAVTPAASNENENRTQQNFKQHGFNQYEINLNEYNLNKGFYRLEVTNTKNEKFLLKFYLP